MGQRLSYIIVAIILPIVFILICCVTAIAVNRNRSWYFKLIIWGSFSGILISPVLSVVASQIAMILTNDGWRAIGVLILSFELAEAISVLLLLTGLVGYLITKLKNKPKKSKPQSLDS